jgi:hypothetical protein
VLPDQATAFTGITVTPSSKTPATSKWEPTEVQTRRTSADPESGATPQGTKVPPPPVPRGQGFHPETRIKNGRRRELLDDAFKKEMAPSGVIIAGTGLARQGFCPSSHLSHRRQSCRRLTHLKGVAAEQSRLPGHGKSSACRNPNSPVHRPRSA